MSLPDAFDPEGVAFRGSVAPAALDSWVEGGDSAAEAVGPEMKSALC
jgi:hypothetical protein